MDRRALLAARKRRREKSVDLGGGKKVSFMRPPESDMPRLLKGDGEVKRWEVTLADVRTYVCGWEGFTEADVLGPSVGASDVTVDFDADLWSEIVGDDLGIINKVADAILKSVVDFISEKAEVEKNSEPA